MVKICIQLFSFNSDVSDHHSFLVGNEIAGQDTDLAIMQVNTAEMTVYELRGYLEFSKVYTTHSERSVATLITFSRGSVGENLVILFLYII